MIKLKVGQTYELKVKKVKTLFKVEEVNKKTNEVTILTGKNFSSKGVLSLSALENNSKLLRELEAPASGTV